MSKRTQDKADDTPEPEAEAATQAEPKAINAPPPEREAEPSPLVAALEALLALIEQVSQMSPMHEASHAFRGQHRITKEMISRLKDG